MLVTGVFTNTALLRESFNQYGEAIIKSNLQESLVQYPPEGGFYYQECMSSINKMRDNEPKLDYFIFTEILLD